MGKESEKRIDICIHITESFAIHLKWTQHWKSTILQYIIQIQCKKKIAEGLQRGFTYAGNIYPYFLY